jgi:aldehyde dehydrogenase (NAD+)
MTTLESRSPIDGAHLGTVETATRADVDAAVAAAHEAFQHWRLVPAPKRGDAIRRFAERLREN